jgi:putative NIF3 family GTP cyclohydrolase 1 type 2
MRGNCALYSSHLPLDAHPEIGNNALLARQLGLRPPGLHPNEGGDIGGSPPMPPHPGGPARRLEALYPGSSPSSSDRRGRGRSPSAAAAATAPCAAPGGAGVDTLVTGELREEWFNVAQEERLNLYLCGHYATEVHAVRALAAELSAKFGLPWEFIATENPL